MFSAIIPLLFDLSAEIKETGFKVNHGMPDFAHEVDFGGPSGEIIESDFKLVLSILVKSIPDKDNAMPY